MATATKNGIKESLSVQPPETISPYLNLLVYGPPGVGKTWFAGTAEDSLNTNPVLFLDVEGGTLTLRKRKDLDVVRVRGTEDLVDIHNKLKAENNGYYKTVVIDSLTELQKLDMAGIMRELVSRRPDLDEDVPSQREWGKSIEHMRRIVRAYRDLEMNTIFTCLVIVDKDDNGTVTYTPSLPGKLKMEISGFVDVVGYMTTAQENGETTRRLQFAQTRKVIAKDRTDALGDVVDAPTIPMLWELMHNNS
jgi:phage nucleotide-binding protein